MWCKWIQKIATILLIFVNVGVIVACSGDQQGTSSESTSTNKADELSPPTISPVSEAEEVMTTPTRPFIPSPTIETSEESVPPTISPISEAEKVISKPTITSTPATWFANLSFDEVVLQAKQYQLEGRYRQSNEGYFWLKKMEPNFREAYVEIAVNYLKQKTYDQSAIYALQAIEIEQDSDQLSRDNVEASAYYILGLHASYIREDFATASEIFESAHTIDPSLQIAKIEQARAVIWAATFRHPNNHVNFRTERTRAFEFSKSIIASIPEDTLSEEDLVRKRMVQTHLAVLDGDSSRAISLISEAIDLRPDDFELFALKVLAMERDERYTDDDVREMYNYDINQFKSDSAMASFFRAVFLLNTYPNNQEMLSFALQDLWRAFLETEKDTFGYYPKFKIHLSAGNQMQSEGETQSAYDAFYLGLQKYHWNPVARYEAIVGMRGVLFSNGDSAGFIQMIDDVIQDHPSAAIAYVERARFLMQKQQFDDAMRDVTFAISLDPVLPDSYWIRGQIYDYVNERELALDDYQTFVKNFDEEDSDYHRATSRINSLGNGGLTYYQDQKLSDDIVGAASAIFAIAVAANSAITEYRNSDDYVPYVSYDDGINNNDPSTFDKLSPAEQAKAICPPCFD